MFNQGHQIEIEHFATAGRIWLNVEVLVSVGHRQQVN